MKILLIGVGSIGGSLAAFIKKSGYDITLIAKQEEYAKKISEEGLKISGVKGNFCIPIKAFARISQLQDEKYDIVFVATKAYDVKAILEELVPYLKEDSSVVSLQNGICLDLYQEVVGKERTVGCVVGYGATMLTRGEIEITSQGEFIIGKIDDSFKGNIKQIQTILQTAFPTKIENNMMGALYSKLIINSCITSLGAITGLKLGDMMKQKSIRIIFLQIIDDAMNVAKAMNIQVLPYGGKVNYYAIAKRNRSAFLRLFNHLLIRIVGKKYKNLTSSSLQSLLRNQKTEIDYFNGYIAKKGKEYKVSIPLEEKLVEMIREIERKERKITIRNIQEILEDSDIFNH